MSSFDENANIDSYKISDAILQCIYLTDALMGNEDNKQSRNVPIQPADGVYANPPCSKFYIIHV